MSSPSEEPHQMSQSCTRALSSKVLMDIEEGEDSKSLWGSMSDSEIPIATHFSPINFAEWIPWSSDIPGGCSEVDYPPTSVKTPDDDFLVDKESRGNTDWYPKLEGVTDYHSIKFDEPGFYEYGSCYFPKNWPKKEKAQEKKKCSVHNFPHDVLVDMGYFDKFPKPEMSVTSQGIKQNPPKTSLKKLFQGQPKST